MVQPISTSYSFLRLREVWWPNGGHTAAWPEHLTWQCLPLTHWRLWCGSRCQEAAAGALRFRKDIMSDYPFLKKHLRKRNHPTIGHLTLTVTKDDVMLCQNDVSWDVAYALYTFLKSNWAWCHVHVIPELGWRKHPRSLLVNQIIPSGKFQATERPYL